MTATRNPQAIDSQRNRERRAVRSISNSLVLLLPSSAVAAVAWLAPIDIMDRLPWISAVASRLGIDSVINRTAEVTAFQQLTFAAYFMVVLLLAPLSLWAAFRMFRWRGVLPTEGVEFRVARTLWIGVLGFATAGVAVYALFWIPGDPGFCEGCTTDSRLGLGVILGLATYVIPLVIGMSVWRISASMSTKTRILLSPVQRVSSEAGRER